MLVFHFLVVIFSAFSEMGLKVFDCEALTGLWAVALSKLLEGVRYHHQNLPYRPL